MAVIIDDLGDRLGDGRRAIQLPGPVTPAFLPHAPYSARLAREAHDRGKEVMLHLPMDSTHLYRTLGPGALHEGLSQEEFLAIVRDDIAAIPYVSGLNNHMGSLLTTDAKRMGWLMEELRAHDGLYFVDSRTSAESVAGAVAVRYKIPSSRRDVFLDNDTDPAAITAQAEKLIGLALHQGSAIGIAHPHAASIDALATLLPRFAARGVRLVPVSAILMSQQQRPNLWQASLSPSPPDAKNSKR